MSLILNYLVANKNDHTIIKIEIIKHKIMVKHCLDDGNLSFRGIEVEKQLHPTIIVDEKITIHD